MKNYKNNYRRNRYKNHLDKNHKKNGNGSILIYDFQNGSNFQRKNYGRNNHNASNLVEKYSNLAREALSNGDKILSENYLQHADHFARISQIRELAKDLNSNPSNTVKKNSENNEEETPSTELNFSD